jgi:hypothetical protein
VENSHIKPTEQVLIKNIAVLEPESLLDTSSGTSSDNGKSVEGHPSVDNLIASGLTGQQEHVKAPVQHKTTAVLILSIIESCGVHSERDAGTWDAFSKFLPIVAKQVGRNERVRTLLPGFPFKSPNTKDLVIGTLPDLGEELALAHLNGCENIATIYEKGTEVEICSDGVVYSGKSASRP